MAAFPRAATASGVPISSRETAISFGKPQDPSAQPRVWRRNFGFAWIGIDADCRAEPLELFGRADPLTCVGIRQVVPDRTLQDVRAAPEKAGRDREIGHPHRLVETFQPADPA